MTRVAPTGMMFATVSGCAQTAVYRCGENRKAASAKAPARKSKRGKSRCDGAQPKKRARAAKS